MRPRFAAFAAIAAVMVLRCDFGIDTTGLSGGDAQTPADAADESAPADASQDATPPVDAPDESVVVDADVDAASD